MEKMGVGGELIGNCCRGEALWRRRRLGGGTFCGECPWGKKIVAGQICCPQNNLCVKANLGWRSKSTGSEKDGIDFVGGRQYTIIKCGHFRAQLPYMDPNMEWNFYQLDQQSNEWQ